MLSQRTSLRCLEGTFGWFQECWECLSEAGRILGTGLPSRVCLPPFLSPLIDRGLGAREWTCCGHSLKWRATHRRRVAASTHTCNLLRIQQPVFHAQRRKHVELITEFHANTINCMHSLASQGEEYIFHLGLVALAR